MRKRFYKTATVSPGETGFGVQLDGRDLRTPAGAALCVQTASLAAAIAEEWGAQEETIRPDTMPMMTLAATAIDRVTPMRDAMIEQLVTFGSTDLLCYRAEAPGSLAERQRACWQPILDWAEDRFHVHLEVTTGVMPIAQSPAAMASLRRALDACDDVELTALAISVPACGSVLLGLALVAGVLNPDTAFEAAQLDETYQMERWGDDGDLVGVRRRLREDLDAAARYLSLVRTPEPGKRE